MGGCAELSEIFSKIFVYFIEKKYLCTRIEKNISFKRREL